MHWQPVIRLNDYEMYCCMVDENATQQRMTPKLVFENVIAAIRVAEQMLRETRNVHEFNALLRQNKGEESLLQNSSGSEQNRRDEGCLPHHYSQAKNAIGPGGDGLGRRFIAHFMPSGSVPTPEPLQNVIDTYYNDCWESEGNTLLEESQRELWKAQEVKAPSLKHPGFGRKKGTRPPVTRNRRSGELSGEFCELCELKSRATPNFAVPQKQVRVLLGKAKAEGISRALEILYIIATV